MKLLTNITSDPHQEHIIQLDEDIEITINLRFLLNMQIWLLDVEYKEQVKSGFKLSLGVQHINNINWPFDFAILDTDNSGIDPFKVNDFSSGRIELYLIEPNELADLRGYSVEI